MEHWRHCRRSPHYCCHSLIWETRCVWSFGKEKSKLGKKVITLVFPSFFGKHKINHGQRRCQLREGSEIETSAVYCLSKAPEEGGQTFTEFTSKSVLMWLMLHHFPPNEAEVPLRCAFNSESCRVVSRLQ
ncbi:hypothetical protein D4764_08G0008560 [Takifugu flavidus]|uniref:Uncharacterized protein n=1 Tax=Takifugu flavidus TaxID=433684 RepID=A0A5C6MQ24_9TELE|nr:hypothetical protein D4764_08G0008560 [Takifugu flavidus]